MASPRSESTYQQSGPSAPQTARAVLFSPSDQQRGFGNVPAKLVTAFTPPDTTNDLLFQARASGAGGEAITVAIVVAGNNTAFSIGVVGNAITINAATDATGNSISRAGDVRDAVNTDPNASPLISAAVARGDGSKVVKALAATNLAGDVAASIGQGGNQPLPKQHPASNSYA